MSLRKTGTRLVMEGAGTYITRMKSSSKANREFGKSAGEAGDDLDKMSIKSVAVGTVIGGVFLAAMQKGTQALAALGAEAVGVFVEHEQLAMSMTSLVAKELRAADATLEMAEAQELASDRASELLGWIQQLAIKSPFDQAGVADAFRTALAYGFTTDEAQRLTAATIDFTTATGATGPVMNQVALALGQIKAKGKLAGQEMLQLVNAGINVREMLDQMGYSTDDVSAGLVSADEFMLHFVETMENDFGGAAARSSETLGGLINSLDDLKAMGLRELFGPIFEAALPSMGAFTTKMQELLPVVTMVGSYLGRITTFVIENRNAILKGAMVLGTFAAGFLLVAKASAILTAATAILTGVVGALGAAVTFLLSPIGLVALAVGGLAALFVASFGKIQEKTGGFFNGMSKDLFSFGEGLIMALAEGMAAAMTAVIQVLTAIGNLIAYWLAPGSPPRLLPDIDKWGTEAMQQFLGGMDSADMDMFDTISNKFEGFMRSFAGGESTGLNQRILDMRQSLMSALGEFSNTGAISNNAFDEIFKSMQITNPALQGYAREIINVHAAQQKLNDISKKYSEIMQGHQTELDAIAQRRQEVVDSQRKAELESILETAKARGDALAVEMAELELKEMAIKEQMRLAQEQEKIETDAAKEELSAAEERLKMQEAVIDAMVKNNELTKEEAEEMKAALGGGAGGAGGAAGGESGGIGGLLDGMGGVSSGIGDALGGLQQKFEQFVQDLAGPFQNIKDELGLLTDAWSDAFINIGFKVGEFMGTMREHWGEGGTWAGIMDMATWIITSQWGEGGTWSGNMELLKIMVTQLQEHWESVFGEGGLFPTMFKNASEIVALAWGEDGTWSANMDLLETAVKQLQEKFNASMDKIKEKVDSALTWISDIQSAFQGLYDWVSSHVFQLEFEFPELPEWAQFGSPLKLHHKMMDFDKFLKRTTFEPNMRFDRPVEAAPRAQMVTNNYVYNQQQLQGIGNLNSNGGASEIAIIQAVVERAIQRALTG